MRKKENFWKQQTIWGDTRTICGQNDLRGSRKVFHLKHQRINEENESEWSGFIRICLSSHITHSHCWSLMVMVIPGLRTMPERKPQLLTSVNSNWRLLRNVKRPGVIHTTDATYGNISQKTAETEWIGISYTCICAGPSLKTCRSNSITRCVWVSWVSASSATFRSFSIIAEMSVITPRVQMQFPCHSALGAGETNERWAPWSNSTSKRSCASCWWGRQKLAEKMDQWSWRKVNLKSYFQIRTQLSIAFQSWKALALRIKLAREDQDLSARQAFLVAAEHQAHLQLHTCTTLKWKTFYSWKGGRMW